MSELTQLAENLKLRTDMYLFDVNYSAVCGYISGYNHATMGGALRGFHEFLVPQQREGNNFAWPRLVLVFAFPKVVDPVRALRDSARNERTAMDKLFELLVEFDTLRDSPNGMRIIYARYEAWLKRRKWFGPGSPEWIDLEG